MPAFVPYSDYFASFMLVFSIITSISSVFQVIKILKTRSTQDVSATTWAIYLVSNLSWLYYGLMIQDLVVFLSSIIPACGSGVILILMCVYRGK